ncbi:MAG TPA: cytochrome P450 [Acidimicrobiales bacterium]
MSSKRTGTDADVISNDTEELDVFAAKDRLQGIGLVRDPHPRLRELREQCPVHRGSVSGIFGVVGPDNYIYPDDQQVSVFPYEPVERGFRDPQTFSSSYYVPSLRGIIGRTILEMDPPEHQRYRTLIQGAFTKKEMARWEREFVRDIVASKLDAIGPLKRGDLATDFAFHYPITVMAVAAGLPVDDVPTFYEQAAMLTNVSVPEERRLRASEDLGAIVRRLIDDRRREPRNDLISILVRAELTDPDTGERHQLSDDEVVAFIRLLVPAGAQTTYRTLTNLLFALLTHPDQLDALRADPSLVPQAVEEGLRWEAPLMSFGRIATVDTEIEGYPIAAGTTVNLCIHTANRDPSRWERPDEFDIFRPPQPHLAFGTGNHTCLGIHFARMELRVALELILEKLPGLRLDPDAHDVHISGLASRTAVNLPCVWDVPSGKARDHR